MADWKTEALEMQQDFYEKLGDRTWDYIRPDQRWALESKVGFAMFGEPTEASEVNNNGYTKEQNAAIQKICDIIYEVRGSSDIYIAFLFVIGKGDGDIFMCPVFRLLDNHEVTVFLDNHGRCYKNWNDYEENNKCPKGELLYPKGGEYQCCVEGNVIVKFDKSPASRLGAKALTVLDVGSAVITVGTIGVGIASLFIPVAGPLIAAATLGTTGCGIYGIGRGSQQLHDRRIHNQSISLSDSEARNCWLSVLGSAFGVGSGLAVKGMVAAVAKGEEIGRAGKIAVDMLNFGSLTINGLGIANGLGNLIEKNMKDELTALDVLQFTTSVLFFTNAAMNAKTATSIIKQVQTETISNYKVDLSKRRTKAFNKLLNKSGGDGTESGRARIIKGISNVESKDEFFRMTIRAQKQSSSTALNEKGRLEVDGKPYVDTKAELQTHVKPNTTSTAVPTVLKVGQTRELKLNSKTMTLDMIIRIISRLKKFIKLSTGKELKLTEYLIEKLAELIKRYFSSQEDGPFSSSNVSDIINQSEKLAQDRGCETEADFIEFTHFLIIYEKRLLKDMENRYQKAKNDLKEKMGEVFDESVFDSKWGIQNPNDREGSFLKKINEKIKDSNEELKKEFDLYNVEITALNQDGGLKFRSNYKALNEFYRVFVFDGGKLLPKKFFAIIRQVSNDERYRSEDFVDGNCRYHTYSNGDVIVKLDVNENGRFLESVSFLSMGQE